MCVYLSSLVFDLLNCDATVLWVILTHNSNESLFDDKTKQIVYTYYQPPAERVKFNERKKKSSTYYVCRFRRKLYGLTVDNRA